MMDLTKKSLPNTVSVGGRDFLIYTDFRLWMRFEMESCRMQPDDLIDVSYLFQGEVPQYCDIRELYAFSRPQDELPRQIKHTSEIVLDYGIDADYIYAAFMSQYGIDLINIEELHWHKFLALFKGLKDDEMICKIMSYRCYERSEEKKDIYEELKQMWRIEYTSREEQEESDRFSNIFY